MPSLPVFLHSFHIGERRHYGHTGCSRDGSHLVLFIPRVCGVGLWWLYWDCIYRCIYLSWCMLVLSTTFIYSNWIIPGHNGVNKSWDSNHLEGIFGCWVISDCWAMFSGWSLPFEYNMQSAPCLDVINKLSDVKMNLRKVHFTISSDSTVNR